MNYLVRILDEQGNFELIDQALLTLYPDVNVGELVPLSDEQYQDFCARDNGTGKFIDGEFVFENVELTAEQRIQFRAAHQAQMWERIKQKRYQAGLGGVYIERVGKWFQTGEEEKTKYLGLDKVIDKVGEIDWKCADNSFIKLDRALLDDIFMQMVVTENADHLNAEKHRLAMLEADNPLEYDYSAGWTKTYADYLEELSNE